MTSPLTLPSPPGASAAAPALACQGLVKTFGPVTALAGVDLSIAPGDSISVMGPSGSGKSTLLHCLSGILKPDAGSVIVDGREIARLGERERSTLRREQFGFVFQFGQLLSELPAVENVALPLMLLGTPRRQAIGTARGWLHSLGLGGKENRRPGELSGGEAQRVAVARALIARPKVVFADEPTGSLDTATGVDVMRVLTEATRSAGAALVVVTHEEDVARWCARGILMRDGQIVGQR